MKIEEIRIIVNKSGIDIQEIRTDSEGLTSYNGSDKYDIVMALVADIILHSYARLDDGGQALVKKQLICCIDSLDQLIQSLRSEYYTD